MVYSIQKKFIKKIFPTIYETFHKCLNKLNYILVWAELLDNRAARLNYIVSHVFLRISYSLDHIILNILRIF